MYDLDEERKDEKRSCRTCRYFSSDSCRDALWYVCIHDEVLERFPEGRVLPPDIKTPLWCPLKMKGEKE